MKAGRHSSGKAAVWVSVALILSAMGWGSPKAWALPPLVHQKQGVIDSVHVPVRALVVRLEDSSETRAFIWTDRTRFMKGGVIIDPESLRKGMKVKVSYRKELGRFVLREVKVEGGPGVSRTKPGVGFR